MGFGAPPSSFGRPREPEPEPGLGGFDGPPVLAFPKARMPIEVVADEQSLRVFAERIRAAIADALMSAFDDAVTGMEHQARQETVEPQEPDDEPDNGPAGGTCGGGCSSL